MKIETIQQGKLIYYIITNHQNVSVTFVNYGARLLSFQVPVKGERKRRNIVRSGYTLEEFKKNSRYFGATIGRVAGRIQNGQAFIGDQSYFFTQNEKNHTLHGGENGFESQYFQSDVLKEKEYIILSFYYKSKDLENGFPGNLLFQVDYTFTEENELKMVYRGKTDKETLFNPTNHSYFNLGLEKTIDTHFLLVNSDYYLPLKKDHIPTGEIKALSHTPFDFTKKRVIGELLNSNDEQITMRNGVDHPFILNEKNPSLQLSAPDEKIILNITTTRNAMVLFSSNFSAPFELKHRLFYPHGALAIEPQELPDNCHHKQFDSSILKPNEIYEEETIYEVIVNS